jgi:hypothetical protein
MTTPIVLPRFTYHDTSHAYTFDGRRMKSITTVAKDASDTYNMNQWRNRQVAIGVTADERIREDVANFIGDNGRLNDLCEEAVKVAGGMDAARKGTQIHGTTELVDLGRGLITDTQRAHADQYQRTLRTCGIEIIEQHIEQIVFSPDDGLCGRTDRYAIINGDLCTMDTKTGYNAVKYPHATGVQLRLQVSLPLMMHETHFEEGGSVLVVDSWLPLPAELRTDIGYVLYLPTDPDKDGVLYRFDLERPGRMDAASAARAVIALRHYRADETFVQRVTPQLRPAPTPALPAAPPTLSERIMGLADVDKNRLREAWVASELPMLGQPMTAEQLLHAHSLVDAVDPFLTVAERPAGEPLAPVIELRPVFEPADEGEQVDPATVMLLSTKYQQLPVSVAARVATLNGQATQYGHQGFHLSTNNSERRYCIAAALIDLGANDIDDETLRALVYSTALDPRVMDERVPVGAAVSSLGVDHARTFATLAHGLVNGLLVGTCDEHGHVVLAPIPNINTEQDN